ncbi:16S rRNA (cytidine(1402)-2'-O)-methyltransferase [Allobaculum sp. Allo2]|uniref:16S rRNA (cytidine(1402)-2'-O)-methyltransferase n=1 Tax=Allobaculum sp. Allo2 TaxID=2853432 RepID=UPI00346316DC
MNRQKSFQNENGPAVYLVPTPIGNLSEISPRQKEALENADVIACEDTRNSGLLLKSIGIHKPLIAHHEYNAHTSSTGILKLLEEGKKVAVISDAGYPLISDPGSELVRLASQAGYPVIPVSGSNAALNALVASGLETSHFLFYGFLDAKSVRRKKELESLKSLPYTVIFTKRRTALKKCWKT